MFQIKTKRRNQIAKLGIIALSVAVSLSIVTFFCILTDLYKQKHLEGYRTQILRKLTTQRASLETELNSTLFINRGLIAYVRSQKGIDPDLFWELAKELYQESPHIRNLGIAPNNILTNVYPLEGNEDAIGLSYLNHPTQKEAVLKAIQTKSTLLAGPLPLVQGGNGLISRTPIFIPNSTGKEETYWGMISIVVNTDSLLEKAGIVADDGELLLSIRGKDARGSKGVVFFGDAQVFHNHPITLPINIPGGTWELGVIPKQGWKSVGQIPPWLLKSGFFLAFLFGLLVYKNLSYQLTLKRLACYDSLTHLPNRRFFSQCFIPALEHSKRHQRKGAILVLDLDGFKQINDTYGHNMGDITLQAVSIRLSNELRSSDLIARIGGDEFWILLLDIETINDASVVARRLIEAMVQPIILRENLAVTLGISIGIAIFPDHGWEHNRLIELADTALYKVKERGKNSFEFASQQITD